MEGRGHKIEIHTPDPGYTPFPVSIMNRSTREFMTFNPSHGETATISYSLNKPGCIRLRAVRRDQSTLLIRTLLDWTEQDFGRHEITWDGRDASGNLTDPRRILVRFEAKDQGVGLRHQDHEKEICRDPQLALRTKPETLDGVRGILEVRTTFLERAFGLEKKGGFEVRYFLDYKPFRTERAEAETQEFVLALDTSTLQEGEHILTVNVDDLHDHIGSASVEITVGN